jgi:hypothetical protein
VFPPTGGEGTFGGGSSMGLVLVMGAAVFVAGIVLLGAGTRRREGQGIRWDE